MKLRCKREYGYLLGCLLLAPVQAFAQSGLSAGTALLTLGSFLVCLYLFFLLIRSGSKPQLRLPESKPGRKERRIQMKQRQHLRP